jgi:UDPglucose--hexose-1-phosphate uridylyltransferase
MELRSRRLVGATIPPGASDPVPTEVEVRWDPLTGHSSRILTATAPLIPPQDFDLAAVAEETRPGCPFCGERVLELTPRLPPEVWPEGRIRRGEAVLFPNILAYAQHAAVSVYSPREHFLPLDRMTRRLVADNLWTQVTFVRAVSERLPEPAWGSVNANHMLPSGGSLFHPHLQGSVDPVPTTMQALLARGADGRFEEYLEAERRAGPRYLGSTGRVEWLASFAPIAPAELRALVPGASSPADLDDAAVEELGAGIATALGLYAELGLQSCNMALYGAPSGTRGYWLNLRVACRSNLRPLYRSDATYFERLHWEGAVDLSPEHLAERAGDRFRR